MQRWTIAVWMPTLERFEKKCHQTGDAMVVGRAGILLLESKGPYVNQFLSFPSFSSMMFHFCDTSFQARMLKIDSRPFFQKMQKNRKNSKNP